METIHNKLAVRISLFLSAILLPMISFADAKADLAAQIAEDEKKNMIMEVACVAVFVGGVIAFLIWKSSHDKKVRAQQMEQMKKIQAAKKRAA